METIKSDNELIAEFMGLIRREADSSYNKARYYKPHEDKRRLGHFVGYFDSLKYHTHWDYLMPVVVKIRLLFQDNSIFDKGREKWNLIALCLETVEIASVHLAVVQFIKWYNNQKSLTS